MLGKFRKGECNRFREKISPYIDNKLASDERQALERHMSSCSTCSRELESLRATVKLLHCVPMAPTPRSFSVVETKPVSAPKSFGMMRWATAVVVLALVVLATGDLFRIYPEKSGTSPSIGPQVSAMATPMPSPSPNLSISTEDASKSVTEAPRIGALQHPLPSATATAPAPSGLAGQTSPTATPNVLTVPTGNPAPAPGQLTNPASSMVKKTEEEYRWPVRQIELGVLGLAVVLLGVTIITRQRRLHHTR